MQDNDNLEMMTHLEGPIVDSFYDMSLISWSKEMQPPLPYHATPAAQRDTPTWQTPAGTRVDLGPSSASDATALAKELCQNLAAVITSDHELPEHTGKDPHYDPDIAAEVRRSLSVLTPRSSERKIDAITRHLSKR